MVLVLAFFELHFLFINGICSLEMCRFLQMISVYASKNLN